MLFYVCYIFFLSRDTFYFRNRIALITMMLLSLSIPLFRIVSYSAENHLIQTNPVSNLIYSGTSIGTNMASKITLFDTRHILVWFYLFITLVFLLRLLLSLTQTFLIIRKGVLLADKSPKVIVTEKEHTPFSFYPYIVIPGEAVNSENYPEIIAHESAHVHQRHTFDLLLSEFMIAFLWFNPFIWLIKRSIILNHEYLADNYSIRKASNAKEYQYKLLNIRKDLTNVPLAHNFSSLIKNRIVMINKKPTSNYAALKSILILPTAAILFILFAFRQESAQVNQEHLFSKSSESEILKFLAINTGYPQEARNMSDTGKIYVAIKMAKGGIINSCKAYTDRKNITVPILPQVVIVGNKSSGGKAAMGEEHSALKTECIRVVNKLGEVKIPEWKDKATEFAVEFKFILK